MPKRLPLDPWFEPLLRQQDHVVHRDQALAAGWSADAIDHRLESGQWQIVLPSVYLCHPGGLSRRQRLLAALLYCGDGACIDGVDACRFHGLRSVSGDDEIVYVVVPADSPARSMHWVRVRRSSRALETTRSDMLRYLAPAPAVVAATRRMTGDRQVLALFSEAAQRRIASPDELLRAHLVGPPKNARRGDRALGHVRQGIRSAPEGEFRTLAEVVDELPPLLYNCRLMMPDGRVISPDALAPDAPLIHETNGKLAHERADLFEDMQARHDYLTSVGFTVLHNPPRRIYSSGREVIAEFVRCHRRLAGTGWPAGVRLIERAA